MPDIYEVVINDLTYEFEDLQYAESFLKRRIDWFKSQNIEVTNESLKVKYGNSENVSR